MPSDFIYWNPAECDSDESLSNTCPASYMDPWDLENYIYIREHLDPREHVPELSSLEDAPYYAPLKIKRDQHTPPFREQNHRQFDSLLESEYGGTAKYAEIEDVYGEIPNYPPLANGVKQAEDVRNFGVQSLGLEPYIPRNVPKRSPPAAIYDTARPHHHHHRRLKNQEFVNRRMSYSYGDYEYNSPQSLYTRLEGRKSESERPSPIYDDIGIGSYNKPDNFGLSTYGHLQIDYSCSWNNLDKYIYH